MKCPRCGAGNPDAAPWCTQCYLDFHPKDDVVPPHVLADANAATASPAVAGGGRFRRAGEDFEWRCTRCDDWNAVGLVTCPTCGAPFQEEESAVVRDVNTGTMLFVIALLPGLGHMLIGRTGTGAVRAAMYLLWLIGGILLLTSAGSVGRGLVAAGPLLAGAAIVWLATLSDVVNAANGSAREVLTPRMLFWLVVGVLALLLITFMISVLSVRASGS